MSDLKTSRVSDYIKSKREFCDGLILLQGYMKAAGKLTGAIAEMVDAFIAYSTEEFINDPNAHYPAGYMASYFYIIESDLLLTMWEEESHILPPGFALRATRRWQLVVRNKMRCEQLDVPDEKIEFGRHLQFPG